MLDILVLEPTHLRTLCRDAIFSMDVSFNCGSILAIITIASIICVMDSVVHNWDRVLLRAPGHIWTELDSV